MNGYPDISRPIQLRLDLENGRSSEGQLEPLFITFQPYRAVSKRKTNMTKLNKVQTNNLNIGSPTMESYFQAHSVQQRTISGSAPWRRLERLCLTGCISLLSAQYAWRSSWTPQFTFLKKDMDCAKLAGILSKLKTNLVQCAMGNS